MKEDISSNVEHAVKQNGKWAAKQGREIAAQAETSANQAMDVARDAYDRISEYSVDAFGKARTRAVAVAKDYPVQTALCSLAAGFLLGAILVGRSRR